MTFFCAKNIFSSHLAQLAIGSANPAKTIEKSTVAFSCNIHYLYLEKSNNLAIFSSVWSWLGIRSLEFNLAGYWG